MVRNGKFVSFCLLFLLCTSMLQSQEPGTRAVTDRYLAAYKAYQDAMASGLPNAEIKKRLDQYSIAKAAYEKEVFGEKATVADMPSGSFAASIPGGEPPKMVELPPLAGIASLPVELRRILETLSRAKSTQDLDGCIQALRNYTAGHPGSYHGNYAKFELAKILDSRKNQAAQARTLFAEIAADPRSGGLGVRARTYVDYLKCKPQVMAWKQKVNDNCVKMHELYGRYRKTSWLAFPVKIARFMSYLGQLNSFKKTQADESTFRLTFEALAAPFVPPVDVVFGQFQAEEGEMDSESRVRLFYRNSEAWFSRWKLLNEARESIDIQYFIVEKDVFGMSFLGLLLRKAREGVRIRFMIDVRGANKLTHMLLGRDYLQELASFPNVEIKIFNPFNQSIVTFLTDVRRIIASNHDKIIVVDGQFSIIGGRNIANEYLVDKEDDPNSWRDCDVVVESREIGRKLSQAFKEEFDNLSSNPLKKDAINFDKRNLVLETAWSAMETYLTTGKFYRVAKADSQVTKALKTYNDELALYRNLPNFRGFDLQEGSHLCPVKIIDKSSLTGARNDATDQIIRFIDGARREIIIENPYIVLTPRADAALKRAGKRGVKVIIHTNSPQTSDSFPTEAVMLADWRGILQNIPGCRVFAEVGRGQLHAKNFVFDGNVGIVGTYNLDYVSEQINSEVLAAVCAESFGSELRHGILADIAKNTKEYKLATKDSPEFGPADIEGGKNMWLVKALSKMGFLKPLF